VSKPVSYARIFLKFSDLAQKINLTIKPGFVIWMIIVSVQLTPQYVGLQLKPIHNSHFSLDSQGKNNVFSFLSFGTAFNNYFFAQCQKIHSCVTKIVKL
jgi:hypothetical protein